MASIFVEMNFVCVYVDYYHDFKICYFEWLILLIN